MASLKYRRGAWELRYRERSGKQRCERFHGGTARRAPEQALDRQAEVERADQTAPDPADFLVNRFIHNEYQCNLVLPEQGGYIICSGSDALEKIFGVLDDPMHDLTAIRGRKRGPNVCSGTASRKPARLAR